MKTIAYLIIMILLISSVSAYCQVNKYQTEEYKNLPTAKEKARIHQIEYDNTAEQSPYMISPKEKIRKHGFYNQEAQYPWLATHNTITCLCTL